MRDNLFIMFMIQALFYSHQNGWLYPLNCGRIKKYHLGEIQDGSRVRGSYIHLLPEKNWNYNYIIEQSSWITNWRPVEDKSSNQGFTEEAALRLIKCIKMWKGLSPFLQVVAEVPEGHLNWRGLNPKQALHSRPPELERGTHTTSGCKIRGWVVNQKETRVCYKSRYGFKGSTQKISFIATHPAFQWR